MTTNHFKFFKIPLNSSANGRVAAETFLLNEKGKAVKVLSKNSFGHQTLSFAMNTVRKFDGIPNQPGYTEVTGPLTIHTVFRRLMPIYFITRVVDFKILQPT